MDFFFVSHTHYYYNARVSRSVAASTTRGRWGVAYRGDDAPFYRNRFCSRHCSRGTRRSARYSTPPAAAGATAHSVFPTANARAPPATPLRQWVFRSLFNRATQFFRREHYVRTALFIHPEALKRGPRPSPLAALDGTRDPATDPHDRPPTRHAV